MTNYSEKKKAAEQRLEMLKRDALRVADKIKQTLALIAECEAKQSQQAAAK